MWLSKLKMEDRDQGVMSVLPNNKEFARLLVWILSLDWQGNQLKKIKQAELMFRVW